jgi:hypothetical protein
MSEQIIAESEAFYSRAFERIARSMWILLFAVATLLWLALGRSVALSFAIGGLVAALNFHSLKRLVVAFADKVIGAGEARGSGAMVLRFLLRYGLIAIVAYVIFRGSSVSAYGLFAGLALPVPAILIEAAYEAGSALRRGT